MSSAVVSLVKRPAGHRSLLSLACGSCFFFFEGEERGRGQVCKGFMWTWGMHQRLMCTHLIATSSCSREIIVCIVCLCVCSQWWEEKGGGGGPNLVKNPEEDLLSLISSKIRESKSDLWPMIFFFRMFLFFLLNGFLFFCGYIQHHYL